MDKILTPAEIADGLTAVLNKDLGGMSTLLSQLSMQKNSHKNSSMSIVLQDQYLEIRDNISDTTGETFKQLIISHAKILAERFIVNNNIPVGYRNGVINKRILGLLVITLEDRVIKRWKDTDNSWSDADYYDFFVIFRNFDVLKFDTNHFFDPETSLYDPEINKISDKLSLDLHGDKNTFKIDIFVKLVEEYLTNNQILNTKFTEMYSKLMESDYFLARDLKDKVDELDMDDDNVPDDLKSWFSNVDNAKKLEEELSDDIKYRMIDQQIETLLKLITDIGAAQNNMHNKKEASSQTEQISDREGSNKRVSDKIEMSDSPSEVQKKGRYSSDNK